ncbi:MAG: hypothetical protein Q9191_005116 [Dirinaria sp. TL-2023a]
MSIRLTSLDSMYFQYSLGDDKYSPLDVYDEGELEAARKALVESGATVIAKASEHVKPPTNPDGLMLYARNMIQNLRMSEEFAEDTMGCGPLSMAVLQKSETLVRYQLRNHDVLNESNVAGQTPLHLCGDWARGVELLLENEFSCDQLDSINLSPLDYTISMQDGANAASILLKAGSPLTSRDKKYGLKSTLDLALRFDATHGYAGASQWPLAPNIVCLIKHVKRRREDLAVLATKSLAPKVLDKLKQLGTAIDDTRASHTWIELEKAGIRVPPSLETRDVSVYHEVRSKNLAICLYNVGFRGLNEYDQHGMTPLMKLAWLKEREASRINFQQIRERLDLAEWYFLQLTSPLLECRDHDISILHIAAFFGTSELQCIEIHELESLTSRFAGISSRQRDFYLQDSLRLYEVSAILYNWYNVLAGKGIPVNKIKEEVERFVAFSKLDLKHTCCTIKPESPGYEIEKLSEDNVDEFRKEEDELLIHLDDMLRQPDSDWWNSPSRLDILLDVSGEGPPPTLRWAKLWLVQRTYGLDEEACEKIRIASKLPKELFWESKWEVPGLGDEFESWELPEKGGEGRQNIVARQAPDTNHHLETAIEFIS